MFSLPTLEEAHKVSSDVQNAILTLYKRGIIDKKDVISYGQVNFEMFKSDLDVVFANA
jgi:hypothetical protein